jgi:outer membrane protein TolC
MIENVRTLFQAATITLVAWVVMPAAAEAGAASADTEPPLRLADLLREAEENNPEIAAARSLESAAEAVPSQMEALPDPLASVAYTNESLTAITLGESPDSFLTLSWTQEVPYPGKRRSAGEAARREVAMSQRRLDLVRLDVASRVKEAYAELYRIDRSLQILRDSRELLTSFKEGARARYESGEGLLENVLKAQTELAKLDVELEKLSQERTSGGAALNTLLGRERDEPLGPALVLPETVKQIDVHALEREVLERSPEIAEMEAAVRRDEARLDLARRQLKPDLMWGASYMNRGDLDPMVMGMFGLRLPLYRQSKQAQGVVQAERQLEAARHVVGSARLKALAEARDLMARASRAEALARLYAEGVVPQARSALESAAASYGVGRIDFLTLLNDFSALLSYQVDYETQSSERVAALAALERLTARPLVSPEGPDTPAQEAPHD